MNSKCIVTFIITFLILYHTNSKAQNKILPDVESNNSTAAKITFADTLKNCMVIDEWFKSDVKTHKTFLFIQGGEAPHVYTTDKNFEKKYKIHFNDLGCIVLDLKCITRYNNQVFDYLTSIYGKKWVKEIRKDIVGLSQWKKSRR
jgi:hypothetical protein